MRRIAIVGPTGAGKSTLALQLAGLLGIPAYHLDELYWRPGWVPIPGDEWDATLRRIVAAESWIIDGGFTQSMPLRFEAADTLIYLDVPRLVSVVSVVRRRLMHPLRPAPGIARDSRPMFNLQLFRWIWTFPHDHRPVILRLLCDYGDGRTVLHLTSRADVRRFLRAVADAELGSPRGRSPGW